MKTVHDFANIRLGELTGALQHHTYFLNNTSVRESMIEAARSIVTYGLQAYVKSEYPASRHKTKSIILNNIGDKLFVVDGNSHCVAMVIAQPDITIGNLLQIDSDLFRYWEGGYEDGADKTHQPYVTYIPIGVNVDRILGSRQGIDDKGHAIHIIPSDIPYDSHRFDESDRGKLLLVTAHGVEIEHAYAELEAEITTPASLEFVLGRCGVMYDKMSKANLKYGFTQPSSGYDNTAIWYIAERVQQMNLQNPKLLTRLQNLTTAELATKIFASIDAWVRGQA